MSLNQNLTFMELKRRIAVLEVQHNTLTSICTVMAKQLKDVQGLMKSGSISDLGMQNGASRSRPENGKTQGSLQSRNSNNGSKSIQQLLQEKMAERDRQKELSDVREIDLHSRKTTKKSKTKPKKQKSHKKSKKSKKRKQESDSESSESSESEESKESSNELSLRAIRDESEDSSSDSDDSSESESDSDSDESEEEKVTKTKTSTRSTKAAPKAAATNTRKTQSKTKTTKTAAKTGTARGRKNTSTKTESPKVKGGNATNSAVEIVDSMRG